MPEHLRILYVEDHADIRNAIAMTLRSWGHEVTVARNVAEAKAFCGDGAFDLLLTDLGLPDGYGLDVVRYCQSVAGMPAIALTAHGFENDRAEMVSAGFDHFFVKPPDLDQLQRAIDGLRQRLVR